LKVAQSNMRVLLIDDSTAYRDEFRYLLEESEVGFSALDLAMNATEGARLLASDRHDIYFVDYRLPGGSGLALIQAAREAGVTKPIIALTAYDSQQVDAAAEAAGANDFLRKGEFSPPMLSRAIRYARRNAAAVQAAREAESRFLMAQEAADIGVWDWDIAADTIIWSPRQYEIFGLDPAMTGPITRETWRMAIHPDDRDATVAAVTAALGGDAPFRTQFRTIRRIRGRTGATTSVHWISAIGTVQRDSGGSPVRMVGINIDITEQRNTLAAVQDSRNLALAGMQLSESRFQTYFDSAPECLFIMHVTPDRRFVYEAMNPAGLAQAGMTLAMVRGRTPEEVLGAQVGGVMTTGLRHVLETGVPYLYEPTFAMRSGTIVYDSIYMPLRHDTGDVTGILGSARDITERRQLEVSLHQTRKMEALGQLAGGVAHDFNNLLTVMLGCLELLDKQVASDRGRALVAEGYRTVERGTGLTNRLLAFSRRQPMTTQPVDINASIQDMTELLGRTLSGAHIGKRLAADLWLATADRNQIELAILNLAINARDAMPSGGSLGLETRNETVAGPRDDGLAIGDYVAVAVSDTGNGMTPEVLARAMDPFFTTKEAGKGTGLGLSMVYGMVRQLGGSLRIASEPGRGTCVTLYLPRAMPEAPPAAATASPLPAAAILLATA